MKTALNNRRVLWVWWCFVLSLLLAAHWYPIRFTILRGAMVIGVSILYVGTSWFLWHRQWARRILCGGLALLLAIWVWPTRSDENRELRGEYVRALQDYRDVPYVWGGESVRGIDCSGLVRCAMIDANVRGALKTANPALLRRAFDLWWHDASAKAMKDEYLGQTRLITTAPNLNQLDETKIAPGDFAVTSNGVHVLAYVRKNIWIEADPNALHDNRVIMVATPTRNAWFNRPVHIMRWRQFDSPN